MNKVINKECSVKQILYISDLGIISLFGIRIGMSPEEVRQILDKKNIRYIAKRLHEDRLSNLEITVEQYKLSDDLPPCDLRFSFRYGQQLYMFIVKSFFLKIEQSTILYEFFKDNTLKLGLNIKEWDCFGKENNTKCYLYNWAQSIEITIYERHCNSIHQNPVTLIIKAHDSEKVISELVRLSEVNKNINRTGYHFTVRKWNKRTLTYYVCSLILFSVATYLFWPSKSTREPAEKKIGRYLYIDNANVLHTKNGCSAVYKERSMQPVEPILKEELNRQSLRRVCSKCVSEKQLDSLRWYVEYTDEGNDIDKDTWD